MGVISQNMKASISFGGNIDASWGRSTEGLNKGLKTVGKQSEKLVKQQRDLADQIKKTKMAGKDISGLKKDYAGVTREIKKAEAAQEALNRDLQKAERLKRFGSMGRGMFGKSLGIARGTMMSGLGIGGAGIVGTALSSVIAPATLNRQTAENMGKATSYGVGIETYSAWDGLAKQMGMNGENIGDLAEELKNKVGEYKSLGKMSSLEDAFSMMGFGSKAFKGLDNEQQMAKVFERALKMQDEQKAASAVDMLMGGEANKILTYMRATGKSYQQLMDEQKRYNLVTKEGAEGARQGNIAYSNLNTVLTSGAQEIAGVLGKELAPEVTKLADDLSSWLKGGGIKQVSSAIQHEWLPKLKMFGEGLYLTGQIAFALAKKLSWVLPDEKADKQTILQAVAENGMGMGRFHAQRKGLEDWFNQNVDKPGVESQLRERWSQSKDDASRREWATNDEGVVDKARERLLVTIDGTPEGDSLMSGLRGLTTGNQPSLSDVLAKADTSTREAEVNDNRRQQHKSEVNDNRRQQLTVNVYATENQDPKQVAEEAIGSARRNDVFNGNNSLYDLPEPG